MQNTLVFLILLLFALCPGQLIAAERLSVAWCREQAMSAKPGDILPIGAFLVNATDTSQTAKIRIRCPNGWEAIPLGLDEIQLGAGDSLIYLSMLKVGPGCSCGKHTVYIQLVEDHLVIAEDALEIDIEASIGLKVNVSDVPPMVMGGELFEVHIGWNNTGNIPLPLRVAVATSPECPYEVENIEDGVDVYITPCDDCYNSYEQLVNLKIFHCDTDELLWEYSTVTEVFSQLKHAERPLLSVPSTLGFFAGHEHDRSIVGASLAGGGYINAEAERWWEYELVLPSQNYSGVYNEIEIIRMMMQEPDWRAEVGDSIYGLSPLTEMWRWGRGAQVFKLWDYLELGGLYVARRNDDSDPPEEFGGYVLWRPYRGFFACYNYLHKNPCVDGTSADLHSVQCRCCPAPECFGEVEIACDAGDTSEDGSRGAYRIALSGRLPDNRGSLWCEKIWAGEAFNGYYTGTDMTAFNLEGPLLGCLRGGIAGTWYRQDIGSADDSLSILPDNRYFQAELSYPLSEQAQGTLVGRTLRLRDRQPYCTYNLEQRWLDARWSLFQSGLLLTAGASVGRQEDFLKQQTTPALQAYSFYGCWMRSCDFEWNLQLDTGNIQYYDAKRWRTAVQGGCRVTLSPNTWFCCHANMAMNMPELCLFSHASATLGHTFSNGHHLYCNAQYYECKKAAEPHEWLAYISYEIPFDLVIPQEIETGSVCGVVYDAQTHQPVQGAVVSLSGQRTLTDESGVYRYPAVSPGWYELCVQVLPQHYTTRYENSCFVSVQKGGKLEQPIPLVRACKLEGRVVRYEVEDTLAASENYYFSSRTNCGDFWTLLKPQEGIGSIQLTLVRDACQTRIRSTTTPLGHFRFERLRPGCWTLFVEAGPMASSHEVVEPVRRLNLRVGEEGYLEIEVIPLRGDCQPTAM